MLLLVGGDVGPTPEEGVRARVYARPAPAWQAYVRSGLRMDWHVYGVMRDTSPDAYTPTLGFATNIVSITVVVFLGLLAFIFWLGSLEETAAEEELVKDVEAAFRPPLRPRPVAGNPGPDAEG